MVSRLNRRSGVAVVQIAELIVGGWVPDIVYHVGIGTIHEEVAVMSDEWKGVKYIGFEPNPKTYSQIVDKYPGELFQIALGKECRTGVPFYQPHRHQDGSSLFRRPSHDDVEHRVDMANLDTLFPKGPGYNKVLLWLDAEGNELDILQGGERFLTEVQVINIEMTGTCPSDEWQDQLSIHRWLMDHGFRRQWVHTQRIHVGQQDCIYVRKEMLNCKVCPCPCQLPEYEQQDCVSLPTGYKSSLSKNELIDALCNVIRRLSSRDDMSCAIENVLDDNAQVEQDWK